LGYPCSRVTAKRSDVDLFFYGISEDEAVKRIFEIEAVIRTSQRLEPGTGMTLRTKNAITFISPRWPYRHIQVRPYISSWQLWAIFI
jgi:hypothetical protein